VLAGEEVMGVLRGEEISPLRTRASARPAAEAPRAEPEKVKGEIPEGPVLARDPLKQPG